ncbi:MAG: ribonuclease III [Ignavibacteriaceae bacterium]|nr:ribonuclease III [Ignavibacteriaceae bacterium]
MSKLLGWILEKLKQREIKKKSELISQVFSSKKIAELEKIIGCTIKNKSYYIQALTHRSFLEQNDDYDLSNERLEFLGDSVLSLAVAEYLYDEFPDKDEGFLTKVRAKLVNKMILAEAAEKIKLVRFILLSNNVKNTFLPGAKTILSDALEALIGAIYLDSGLESAKNFIQEILIEPNTKAGLYLIDENFKSQLLEYAQANRLENPSYYVVSEEGPQHNRIFTIKVKIGDQEFGVGTGKSKKSAEQNAAHSALVKIASNNN